MVKGPNRVWSIDGHDKLLAYGFEIYGIIDAYSRKILGMFIGLLNRTQIAVLKYYLATVKKHGVPKVIRVDKGAETVLVAASQFAFRRAYKPDIRLEKTFAYSTSTKNQRIERWWRTLVDGQTDQWIAYFDELKGNRLFDSSKFDRIALQYLYMDTLRNHIASFVTMYNTHPIRRQVQREWYLPAGKPNLLYNYPPEGCRNYSTLPNPALLELIEGQLSWLDETAYLSPVTRALCDDIVLRCNIPLDLTKILPGIDQQHTQIYRELREGLFRAEEAGRVVEELEHPIGALATIEEMVQKYQNEAEKSNIKEEEVDNILGERRVDEDKDEA
jgi:hypothetical protein